MSDFDNLNVVEFNDAYDGAKLQDSWRARFKKRHASEQDRIVDAERCDGSISSEHDLDNVKNLAQSAIEISQSIHAIPIKLTFKDLTYRIKVKNTMEQRQLTKKSYRKEDILKGVSGYVLPG